MDNFVSQTSYFDNRDADFFLQQIGLQFSCMKSSACQEQHHSAHELYLATIRAGQATFAVGLGTHYT
jgi:hypothetical protein